MKEKIVDIAKAREARGIGDSDKWTVLDMLKRAVEQIEAGVIPEPEYGAIHIMSCVDPEQEILGHSFYFSGTGYEQHISLLRCAERDVLNDWQGD